MEDLRVLNELFNIYIETEIQWIADIKVNINSIKLNKYETVNFN